MNTEWRKIEGFNYEISNIGIVKNSITNKILKPRFKKDGYIQTCLTKNKKQYYFQNHVLVAKCFINNPHNKPFVNHIDGNKQNNNIDNLEWVTRSENMKHAFNMGLCNNKGSKNPFSKLTEIDILYIRSSHKSNIELSKELNISKNNISTIKNRKSWNNI